VHDQTQTRHTTKNHILNALPDEEYNRLHRHLEPVQLTLGQVLHKPEEPITHVYFMNDAMCSILATTLNGQCAEVGVIGREGVVGVDVFMGVEAPLNEFIIQNADGALRIKTEVIKKEFKSGGVLQDLLLRYIHAFMAQISQTALCNRLHPVEQRLARWLLMSHDRAKGGELTLTQDFLSLMLGVNRPTVSTSAAILQGGGFIKYSRGKITITDREGLEDFSCDCYEVVKKEYDWLDT
jgi:CRP-like cAMP-binding protein